MGIRFYCPRGHKLNVKAELAGKIGICPECGQRMLIPFESTRESTHKRKLERLGIKTDDAPSAETGELTDPVDSEETTLLLHQPATNSLPAGAQIPPDLPSTGPAGGPPKSETTAEMSGAEASAAAAEMPTAIYDRSASAMDELASTTPEPGAVGIDANPLLADPNLVWYTRGTDNQSYGPVTNVVMKSWIKERRIGPTMLIWREGWSTWLEAKNVFPELEAIFTPPVAEPRAAESAPVADAAALIGVKEDAAGEMERKRTAAKKRKKKESRDLILVIGLIAVIVLLVVILVVILTRQTQSPAEAEENAAVTLDVLASSLRRLLC